MKLKIKKHKMNVQKIVLESIKTNYIIENNNNNVGSCNFN